MLMKAQRLYGPKDLRFMEIPIPEPGPFDVRIKVKYCGVCATDYAIYSGETGFYEAGLIRTPMTLGHEYSGVVDMVGEQVSKFKPGDRVVADTCTSCSICEPCMNGDYLQCENMQAVGTINCIDGGFAEYTIMPQRHVIAIPDGCSFETGALCEPTATAMYAVRRAQIRLGETIMIIGTGPIGLTAVPAAKLSGSGRIILCGRNDFKLDTGRKLGADYTINMMKENMGNRIMELTGGKGVDVVIETTGAPEMLRFSLDHAASNGRISIVAFYEKMVDKINVDKIVLKNIRISGVSGSPNMAPVFMRLMREKRFDLTPLITAVYPLKEAERALLDLKNNRERTIKILLNIGEE